MSRQMVCLILDPIDLSFFLTIVDMCIELYMDNFSTEYKVYVTHR